MSLASIRRVLGKAYLAHAWQPTTLPSFLDGVHYRRRNELAGFTDDDHLRAAAEWLGRAQDASTDGGVAGRYRLGTGWTSSYPETTGYIVPTLVALEAEAGLPGYHARAARCIDFLLGIQLPDGAFPGLEIAENRERPSIFNSAQILSGLTAWHRATGDQRTLDAARRCADWLVSAQDADGMWRQHLYGAGQTYTYMAHAGCWLAEFGEHVGDARYLDAARAHLEWVLKHVDPETGWIDDCGFGAEDQKARRAVTHTIAYTIWGILLMSRILGHERGLAVARRAAHAVARRLELSRWLPGKLDWKWRGASTFACLTGNAQMALIFMELHRLDGDPMLLSSACRAIDLVKRAQPMHATNPGIRGGIAGSDPIWGEYISITYPNWAAKFFLDALLAKKRALAELTLPAPTRGAVAEIPADVPQALPPVPPRDGAAPKVALLAGEWSPKVEQFVEAWSAWGFRPDVVVVPRTRVPSRGDRMRGHARDFGVGSIVRRLLGRGTREPHAAGRQGTIPTSGASVPTYCASKGIPVVMLDSLDAPADVERLKALGADVFVYAGCGIMRAATLAIPRLGTLNAHMGLLPPMRGMNVTEWSAVCGAPIGCTVHLIDPGIDTGDILAFRAVDAEGADSIDMLRQRVDRAQIALLGDVLQWTIEAGALPPRRSQHPAEGRQYFTMHEDVRVVLLRTLAANAAAVAGTTTPACVSP